MSGMYVTCDYATLDDVPPFGSPHAPGSPFRLEKYTVRSVAYRRDVWWKFWTPLKTIDRIEATFSIRAPIDWRKDVRRRWAAYKVR